MESRMGPTDNKMARVLLPALVAVACGLATTIGVRAIVAIAQATPHVGDIVAFVPLSEEPEGETAHLLVHRSDRSDCVLDLKIIRHSGGSLVVENEIPGQSTAFHVHWAGDRTSEGRGNCGSDADLIVNHHDLDILALSAGGYGVGFKSVPIFASDITN
jgi:hypothetical protein